MSGSTNELVGMTKELMALEKQFLKESYEMKNIENASGYRKSCKESYS